MAAKRKPLPKIEQRDVREGYLHTYDGDGRLCLDTKNRERIVLVDDLRVYGPKLHIGALGWTIPETTDGYTAVDVEFDTGQRLRVKRYVFERVTPEMEKSVVTELLARHKDTKFDSDPLVAASCYQTWMAEFYGEYLTLTDTVRKGIGDQELYAFTFPALMELAQLKGEDIYPVKIGFSAGGGLQRIRMQILEKAGFPEKPIVLCMFKTWDGRHLEIQVHKRLRSLKRKVSNSLGNEWFFTSKAEILRILDECQLSDFPMDRSVAGFGDMFSTVNAETFGEETNETKVGNATVVSETGGSALRLSIRYPEKRTDSSDVPES